MMRESQRAVLEAECDATRYISGRHADRISYAEPAHVKSNAQRSAECAVCCEDRIVPSLSQPLTERTYEQKVVEYMREVEK